MKKRNNQLTHKLLELANTNKDGSFKTQKNRKDILKKLGSDLHSLGYKLTKATGLKPKHIFALIEHWKDKDLSPGTMKNRMSVIRWWSRKIDKQSIVYRSNDQYNLENRVFVTNVSKALKLDLNKLEKIRCEYVKCSLLMQRDFGLRREEAIKFSPSRAIETKDGNLMNGQLRLVGSWTKGGKERVIPIQNEQQINTLNKVISLVNKSSLIPQHKTFHQQLKAYERLTSLVNLNKMHGLRHRYAQEQYKLITGFECSLRGGKKFVELNDDQKRIDRSARLKISKMLGHERLQITSIYLGS